MSFFVIIFDLAVSMEINVMYRKFSISRSISTYRAFLSKLGLGDGVLLLITSSKNKTEKLRYQLEQTDNLG